MFLDIYYYLVVILPIALEGFPISSSGHVELLLHFLNYSNYFLLMQQLPHNLDHILHGPIVCIILIFFYKEWVYFLRHLRYYFSAFLQIFGFIFITTGVTALGYFLLHGTTTQTFPLYYGYAITTVALLSLIICRTPYNKNISGLKALLLGSVQAGALLPGISRFGSTFVAARWLGFSSEHAFRLSFLMELPISFAGFLKGLYSISTTSTIIDLLQMKFLFTILIASCLGLGGFYVVSKIIQRNMFWVFGIYTFLLTVLSWIVQ